MAARALNVVAARNSVENRTPCGTCLKCKADFRSCRRTGLFRSFQSNFLHVTSNPSMLGLARFQQNMVQVLQTGQPCCTVFTMMISAGPFTPKYAWG